MTELHTAASQNDPSTCAALLESGFPWNSLDPQGRSAGDCCGNSGACYDLIKEHGIRAELILGLLQRRERAEEQVPVNLEYLQSPLVFEFDGIRERILDTNRDAVMMGWELPLMEQHAISMQPKGRRVLNVGFGLGLFDTACQKLNPASHTIIEAHPDILKHMDKNGWGKKPGVVIVRGRWQDVLDQLGEFDCIFFDTFGEEGEEMHAFHDEVVCNHLAAGGVYSFFNGLCATNQLFHEVASTVMELNLRDMGLATKWESIPVDSASVEGIWKGVRRRYWSLPTYRLPLVTWI